MILALVYSESAQPITPIYLLKPRFPGIIPFPICCLGVRDSTGVIQTPLTLVKWIYRMLLTISYSESAYPITPVELLKATLCDHFRISVYFVYFIFI